MVVEGIKYRRGDAVGEAVVGRKLGPSLARQDGLPLAPVRGSPAKFNKALNLQSRKQAAEIARIEAEPIAEQYARLRTPVANLEDQSRLAERPSALEIARLERAGAPCNEPVEAANLFDVCAASDSLAQPFAASPRDLARGKATSVTKATPPIQWATKMTCSARAISTSSIMMPSRIGASRSPLTASRKSC